ncbi:MAG: aromatic ring-hydroxylating dioxygenase subunit alpha [Opitutaceae bacterium]|nr:aromatic ring-hydroxylating dioxygenase subunit alpha [Opitutaceae bacterium]
MNPSCHPEPIHPQRPRELSSADYTSEETYRATRLPVTLASTIIPDAYRSAEFHHLEQERIWSGGWVCVGYVSQVAQPGDTFVTNIAGQSFLVTRDRGGGLRAFHNVCRHRGSQLVDKDGNYDVIRCPYHAWGYALDGKLLGTPYFKGLDVPPEQQAQFDMSEAKGFRKEDYPLLSVTVDAWGCFVFLNLSPRPTPLAEWLGDLPARLARYPLADLKLVRRQALTLKCNWKLIAENFMEYYHLPWVHPELCNVSGFNDHYRVQGPGLYTGMCTFPLSKDDETVKLDLPPMPGLSAAEAQTAYWFLIFPNVALFLLPNHLFTLVFKPDGTNRAVEYADLLVHPDAGSGPAVERSIDDIFSFWTMVNAQDVTAVERVQAGLESAAYPGGRMCYRFEEPVHRYQNMVIDRMVGRHRVPPGDAEEDPDWVAALRSATPKAKTLVGGKQHRMAGA